MTEANVLDWTKVGRLPRHHIRDTTVHLLGCPFCGSSDVYVGSDDGTTYQATCVGCYATGSLSTKLDAIDTWNAVSEKVHT